MSSIVNKVKDALHSDKKTSEPEGTHGPHSSRAANAADPRIDSDRDNRAAGTTNYNTTGTTGTLGSTGTTGTTAARGLGTDGPATKTDGPHKSNVMNKADPRVDSDRDHSRNMGMNPHGTSGTGAYNAGSTTGTGTFGTTGKSNVPEGTFGPHSSRAANAADPRVDSDLDNTRNTRSMGTTGTTGNTFGTTGTSNTYGTSELHTQRNPELHSSSGVPEGTYGHHSSRLANAADPRIDSDLDNTRNTRSMGTTGTTGTHHMGTTGTTGASVGGAGGLGSARATGQAPNTAGPHKSDMMNKIDPRVDSDLDGSKTVGGDKTFSQSNTYAAAKDPTDAAQVPPSVLQKHIGAPTLAHDDHAHDRERRHSVSHQEQHRGL